MSVVFKDLTEIFISDVMYPEKVLVLSKEVSGKNLLLTVDVRERRKLSKPATLPFAAVLLLNAGLLEPMPSELLADSGLFQVASTEADPPSVRFSFGTGEADGVYVTVRHSDLEETFCLLFEKELATAEFIRCTHERS